ncbi:MAG: PrsW family intramembrane metalloprotease [Lachnospiraceae bacterium]|nr:PrsW family intramembrane metalloprotease [Lachnospiraceae bacterium]
MSENRTFFVKAERGDIKVKDIFSDVLRRHTPEENARLFIGGTALTTPDEASMLSKWMKPYMFARIFLLVLIVVFVGVLMDNSVLLPFVFVAGSFLVPITVMFFYWELNIPRNISFPSVIVILLVGGMLSLVFTTVFNTFNVTQSYVLHYIGVGVVEELAKILAVAVWVRKGDKKYILTGMLVGAAVGAGFAAIESAGYAVIKSGWSYDNMILRAFLSVGGHVSWAAVSGGALVWVKGRDELALKHFTSNLFLKYFVLVIALHAVWDIAGVVPVCLVLCAIILVVSFRMIQAGLNQVVRSSRGGNYNSLMREMKNDGVARGLGGMSGWFRGAAGGYGKASQGMQKAVRQPPPAPAAYTAPLRIQGVSGYFANRRFALEGCVRIGRDAGTNQLIYPAGTSGISKNHCEVMVKNGRVYIRDLGSTYGTFVNGKRLQPNQVCEIGVGTRVCIGSAREEFRIVQKNI